MQEASLLNRTARSRGTAIVVVAVVAVVAVAVATRSSGRLAVARGQAGVVLLAVPVGRGQVGDVLGHGVLAAHGARIDAIALARLAHGVVAAVEVLALLQVLGEVVRLGGQLAVKPEEALLVGREGLLNRKGGKVSQPVHFCLLVCCLRSFWK